MAEKKDSNATRKFPGRVIEVRDYVKEADNIDWLVQDLLPDVGWTLMVGMKAVGKTTLAIQLCRALETGEDFLGRKVSKRKTLIVQCDSSEVEWREFLRQRYPESRVWTAVAVPNNSFDNPDYLGKLGGLIALVNPGFIVFDSLYRFSSTPVNTDKVLDTIDKFNLLCGTVPFMLLHHPPHEMSRAAGHHSIGATCSNEWHLLKTKLVIDKGRLVKDKEILIARKGTDGGLWELSESDKLFRGGARSTAIGDNKMVDLMDDNNWLDEELLR